MVSTTDRLEQQLAKLRESFAARLPGRVQEIASAWNSIAENGWNAENAKRFHRLIHSLAGAAATFGFATLSQSARQLELDVEPFIGATAPLLPEQSETITDWLSALESPVLQSPNASTEAQAAPVPEKSLCETPSSHCLFLVTQGNAMDELVAQVGYFDYKVEIVQELDHLAQELQQKSPAAILIDADLYTSEEKLGMLKSIHPSNDKRIPTIFISSHGDLAARLASVRAGADAYFTEPVNMARLVDKLDQLTASHAPDPYRVLVVEDDEAMAQYYSMTLKQAGMETNAVSDPNLVLQQLIDWKPDLILMDIHMPHCSGLELATVIRQQEAYVSIPIVYLSSETRIEKQLEAMSLGGDDFLNKSIKPEHLISSIATRVQRSHTLRSLILRDSLTGLLNHTAIKGQLETEIARAKRNHSTLAYAMLDIDHFKRVNDIYGHPIGDGVLKTLARLLQQRLRQTDVIGRYGGEEFAVIMPDADTVQAKHVLEEIRSTFGQIRQQAGSEGFAVTFSAGVAAYPDYGEASSLNDAADRALYQAKQNGRNQIILAQKQ